MSIKRKLNETHEMSNSKKHQRNESNLSLTGRSIDLSAREDCREKF